MGPRRNQFPGVVAGFVAILGVVSLAACSSTQQSADTAASEVAVTESTPAAEPSSAPAGEGDAVAVAAAAVAALQDTASVVWPQPTAAFTPGEGKVAIVPCGLAGTGCAAISKHAEEAAKEMGWESTVFDGQFDPNKQSGFVQQAVAQGYDAIVLIGIDPNSIKSAVEEAAAKEVAITCAECMSGEMSSKVTDVSIDYAAAGAGTANFIIANSDAQAKTAIFTDKAFSHIVAYSEGIKAELEAKCPDCTQSIEYFPTADLAKPGPPTWTAFLAANAAGSFDWVATGYEDMAVPFSKTLQDQGRDDLKITSFNGARPDTTDAIAAPDSPFEATIVMAETYEGWSAVDLAARLARGGEVWDAGTLPWLLVTKDNVSSQENPNDYMPNFDFRALFKSLWQK